MFSLGRWALCPLAGMLRASERIHQSFLENFQPQAVLFPYSRREGGGTTQLCRYENSRDFLRVPGRRQGVLRYVEDGTCDFTVD